VLLRALHPDFAVVVAVVLAHYVSCVVSM